jgi:putative ABC transport system ATP-binding protein
LDGVAKRFRRGHRQLDALLDVNLSVERGEVVSVSGARGSGRTTLVRLAGGVLKPDAGRVLVAGVDLFRDADAAFRRQVVICGSQFLPSQGRQVYEQVMMPLLALGVSRIDASMRAHRALERVGAEGVATAAPNELVPEEVVRVALARAIVREPSVLIMDEPTVAVGQLEREPILWLVHTIARASAIAVLVTGDDTAPVAGSDRCLRLSGGRLLGDATPLPADVVHLRRASPDASP